MQILTQELSDITTTLSINAKKDIEKCKGVEDNKATIFELQAEIRNLQRQFDAANGTFNEMKYNKTVVSQKIVKNG